ncbi:MAG: glycosyltransferase [Streptosporangiales bacterium]|nr:glycosyltransferase [Streptosporangiales bacterium]
MSPRVLVDATAVPADRGALGRYVDGLVAALGGARDGGEIDLAIVCQRSEKERYTRLAPGAHVVAGPAAITHRQSRLAWEQSTLPHVAAQVGADVLHVPYPSMPDRPGVPTVVTVHDLGFFTDPDLHDEERASYLRSATRRAVRRAARMIVPSQATRDDLVEVLDAVPSRIDVAYHGVDPAVFHPPEPAEAAALRSRLGLHGEPYVAYLGALQPRKNVAALVEGWAMAAAEQAEPSTLVLAGGRTLAAEVDKAVAAVPAQLRVVRPGYLAPADLPAYLGGALVVAIPSRGEGFGLPVLEAMSCGAPVLTTRRTSLPEVGGDAVDYTEPEADGIAEGLRRLFGDPERRRRLAEAGRARAAQFTWEASAEAHVASYRRALES